MGRVLLILSSPFFVGILPGKMLYCQPRPVSHFFSGCFFAKAATMFKASCSVLHSFKSMADKLSDPDKKCTCASLIPAVTRRPFKSITLVALPAIFLTAAEVPVCKILFPFIATASINAGSSLPVHTRPLNKIRSAVAMGLFCATTSR